VALRATARNPRYHGGGPPSVKPFCLNGCQIYTALDISSAFLVASKYFASCLLCGACIARGIPHIATTVVLLCHSMGARNTGARRFNCLVASCNSVPCIFCFFNMEEKPSGPVCSGAIRGSSHRGLDADVLMWLKTARVAALRTCTFTIFGALWEVGRRNKAQALPSSAKV